MRPILGNVLCVCMCGFWAGGCLLKGGPKLRPAKFTPAVVMSVGSLEYSGSEAPASLMCKSVYSGAWCEVISSGAAKLRVQGEARGSMPGPFFFYHSPIITPNFLSVTKSLFLCLSCCSSCRSNSFTLDFWSLSYTPRLLPFRKSSFFPCSLPCSSIQLNPFSRLM